MTRTSPSGPPTSDPAAYERQLQRIGVALLDSVPPGWRRIDLRCRASVGVQDLGLTVVMADGTSPTVPPPAEVGPAFTELRRLVYQPGVGTWFSARYMVDPPTAYYVSWNFDFDPRWTPPLSADEFRRDLEAFPRDDEHLPDWLRAALAGAGGEDTGR